MQSLKYILIVLALALSACNHPLEIIGDGDIVSETGDRDCYLEQAAQADENCTMNMVQGAYVETYTAMPRSGWIFDRWYNACQSMLNNECSFNVAASQVEQYWGETFLPLTAKFREQTTGRKSLFIGHSFFVPFANRMTVHAANTGFTTHTQHVTFSGGQTGAPEALWNNAAKRAEIQAVLDAGDVELFGMTYHPVYPGLTGYQNWFNYALSKNPDTRFFIALPWLPQPGNYDGATYHTTWIDAHPQITHVLIDQLRALYPGTEIYCIPYGQAAGELYNRFAADNLPDVQNVIGNGDTAIFTDNLGHAGDILKDLGEYVWLYSVYGVRPATYNHDAGYQTDLRAIAETVIIAHDPHYDAR